MLFNSPGKKVLHVDLKNSVAETKIHLDLDELVGGLGLGLGLLHEYRSLKPLVLAIGPLTGAFPFVSKTAALWLGAAGKLAEAYAGGRLALSLRLAGLDAIMFVGRADQPVSLVVANDQSQFKVDGFGGTLTEQGYPGRQSFVRPPTGLPAGGGLVVDDFFKFGEPSLAEVWREHNLLELVVSGLGSYELPTGGDYQTLRQKILSLGSALPTLASGSRSCSGCPLGCSAAELGGEPSGGFLSHCLVACGFAEKIYEGIPTTFACLTSLGYRYTHEQLEALPSFLYNLREQITRQASQKLDG
ncbi:MAG: aldehyde ferredoxin oxidoreductase N-terminal domain-containing protein [bacterium]|nr:aldehyde ferredoxin oxidoreductase N-terminal domain-containing protein [bacterium]